MVSPLPGKYELYMRLVEESTHPHTSQPPVWRRLLPSTRKNGLLVVLKGQGHVFLSVCLFFLVDVIPNVDQQ